MIGKYIIAVKGFSEQNIKIYVSIDLTPDSHELSGLCTTANSEIKSKLK
jgi:hypothetical protein